MELLKNCMLCPRKCGINRYEKIGVCGANNKIKVAYYSLHMWEEPPISGKNGSGTIFFSNCNLKCVYCQNKKISLDGYGKYISMKRLKEIMLELQEKKAHNINLVTPTHYVPLIRKGIIKAKNNGLNIPIVYNTSSYEKTSTINMMNGLVDIYLADLKYYDDKYAVKYSKTKDYFKCATKAIKEMYKQVGKPVIENDLLKKGVVVRVLLLPGLKEDAKKILKYLYETYHDDIYISIMNQYTPIEKYIYEELNNKVLDEEYNEVIDYACDLGITNAFIQEGETQSESFIPDFNLNNI